MKLSGAAQKYLKGLAHKLSATIQIGKKGLSSEILGEINTQLKNHELIKIKFLDFKDEKKSFMAKIEKLSQSSCVGIIGHVAILYKESKEKKAGKISLPPKKTKTLAK